MGIIKWEAMAPGGSAPGMCRRDNASNDDVMRKVYATGIYVSFEDGYQYAGQDEATTESLVTPKTTEQSSCFVLVPIFSNIQDFQYKYICQVMWLLAKPVGEFKCPLREYLA